MYNLHFLPKQNLGRNIFLFKQKNKKLVNIYFFNLKTLFKEFLSHLFFYEDLSSFFE